MQCLSGDYCFCIFPCIFLIACVFFLPFFFSGTVYLGDGFDCAAAARKAAARRSPRRLPRARALTHPTGPTGQQDMIVPLTSARVGAAAKAKAPAPDRNGH